MYVYVRTYIHTNQDVITLPSHLQYALFFYIFFFSYFSFFFVFTSDTSMALLFLLLLPFGCCALIIAQLLIGSYNGCIESVSYSSSIANWFFVSLILIKIISLP